MLGEQAKELRADVSLHVFAVWRIERNYVSFSASGFLGVVGFTSDFICGVTTLVHCIHIIGCSSSLERRDRRLASMEGCCFVMAGGRFDRLLI